ncbi:MAG: hypothetical protein HYR51_06905 [Candidatus Rokubacteria bacterium]|nr:hypothetical protein [Candidatus Rokubacteria bacterium]
MRKALLGVIAAVVALAAVTQATAQTWSTPDRGLRVEWESGSTKRGPIVSGYVYNDLGYAIGNVRLLIESVDAGGQVVDTKVGYLQGTAPPFDRLYFEVRPGKPAASYRVRVAAWDPLGRGGS